MLGISGSGDVGFGHPLVSHRGSLFFPKRIKPNDITRINTLTKEIHNLSLEANRTTGPEVFCKPGDFRRHLGLGDICSNSNDSNSS